MAVSPGGGSCPDPLSDALSVVYGLAMTNTARTAKSLIPTTILLTGYGTPQQRAFASWPEGRDGLLDKHVGRARAAGRTGLATLTHDPVTGSKVVAEIAA